MLGPTPDVIGVPVLAPPPKQTLASALPGTQPAGDQRRWFGVTVSRRLSPERSSSAGTPSTIQRYSARGPGFARLLGAGSAGGAGGRHLLSDRAGPAATPAAERFSESPGRAEPAATAPNRRRGAAAEPGSGSEPAAPEALAREPLARQLATPMANRAPGEPPAALPAGPPVAEVLALEQLLRRLSWGGNGRRGSARIELAAGELAGATVLVQADDGLVSFELDAPPGVNELAWRRRMVERLRARGLDVQDDEPR